MFDATAVYTGKLHSLVINEHSFIWILIGICITQESLFKNLIFLYICIILYTYTLYYIYCTEDNNLFMICYTQILCFE